MVSGYYYRSDICFIESKFNVYDNDIDTNIGAIEERIRVTEQYRFYTVDGNRFLPKSYELLQVEFSANDEYIVLPEIKWSGLNNFAYGETYTFEIGNFFGFSNFQNRNIKDKNYGMFYTSGDVVYSGSRYNSEDIDENLNLIEFIEELGVNLAINIAVSYLTAGAGTVASAATSAAIEVAKSFIQYVVENDVQTIDTVISNPNYDKIEYSSSAQEQINQYGSIVKSIILYNNFYRLSMPDENIKFIYKYSMTEQSKEANEYETRFSFRNRFDIYHKDYSTNEVKVFYGAEMNKTIDFGKVNKYVEIFGSYRNEYSIAGNTNYYVVSGINNQPVNITTSINNQIIKVYNHNYEEIKYENGGYCLSKSLNYIEVYNSSDKPVEYNLNIDIPYKGEPITTKNEDKYYSIDITQDGWYYTDVALGIDDVYNSYFYLSKGRHIIWTNDKKIENYYLNLKPINYAAYTKDSITGIINVISQNESFVIIKLEEGNYSFYREGSKYSFIDFVTDGSKELIVDCRRDFYIVNADFIYYKINDEPNVFRYDLVGKKYVRLEIYNGNTLLDEEVVFSPNEYIASYENNILSFDLKFSQEIDVELRIRNIAYRFIVNYIMNDKFNIKFVGFGDNCVDTVVSNVYTINEEYNYYINSERMGKIRLENSINTVMFPIPQGKSVDYYRRLYIEIEYDEGKRVGMDLSNGSYDLRLFYFEQSSGYCLINDTVQFKRMLNTYEYKYCTYDDGINNDTIEVWGNIIDGNFKITQTLDFGNEELSISGLIFSGVLTKRQNIDVYIKNLILKYDDTNRYYFAIFDENYGSITNIKFENCSIKINGVVDEFKTRFIYGVNYGYQSNLELNNVTVEYKKKEKKKIKSHKDDIK